MSQIIFNASVTNQFGAPSINENTFANRPSAGQPGRIFVATDTLLVYRDTGSAWSTLSPSTATSPGGSYDSFTQYGSVQFNNNSAFGGDGYFNYNKNSHKSQTSKTGVAQLGIFVDLLGSTSMSGGGTLYTNAGLLTNTDFVGTFTLNSSIAGGFSSPTITLNFGSAPVFDTGSQNIKIIIFPYLNCAVNTPFIYNMGSVSSSSVSFTIGNAGTGTIQTNHVFGYMVIMG